MWTKRESTEEGSALGELVDQVSLFTGQMKGSLDFSGSEYLFVFICGVVYIALQDIFISLLNFLLPILCSCPTDFPTEVIKVSSFTSPVLSGDQ